MSKPLGLHGPEHRATTFPAGYYGVGVPTFVRGVGDSAHATSQSEQADRWEWWGLDESEIEPVRGWDLAKLSKGPSAYYARGGEKIRQLQQGYHEEPPLFVLVRAEGSHSLFCVQATTTGRNVTGPQPLPSAKLALARMRSVFGQMGKVTA